MTVSNQQRVGGKPIPGARAPATIAHVPLVIAIGSSQPPAVHTRHRTLRNFPLCQTTEKAPLPRPLNNPPPTITALHTNTPLCTHQPSWSGRAPGHC